MSLRGEYQTVTAGATSPLWVAGVVIRYGFYAVGAVVLAMAGIGLLSLWRIAPKPVDAPPAFHIAAGSVANKPVSGHVIAGSRLGRIEVRQYGQLNNRTSDLAVVLAMPPKGIGMGTQFMQDLHQANLLRFKRAVMTQTYYDLDTRFGEFRAFEMRVDTDGRWKQCLAYQSRFETPSVYLTGWYCDGTGSVPAAGTLACILDKLVLDQELAAPDADRYLRERMAKPALCQGTPVTQTTDIGHRAVSPPSRWSQPTARTRY